jgi:HEAT repeat protein
MNSAIITLYLLVQSMPLGCLEPASETDKLLEQIEQKANPSDSLTEEEKEEISRLVNQLKDENYEFRSLAAMSLWNIGEKAAPAVPALVEVLKDEDYRVYRVREFAAQALGRIGEKAVPALVEALKDKNSLVRENAAWALRLIQSKEKSSRQ